MANFLTDYSGLAAAGSAFNSFADAYSRAQDQSMKRMESQAQLEAAKQKIQREKDQSQIDLMKQGYTRDSQGNIQEAPLTARQQADEGLKAFGEGAQAADTDANGNATGWVANPNSPKMIQAKNSGMRLAGTEARITSQQKMAAQNTFNKDHLITTYSQRADGASKILELINKADTPGSTVKSTQAILGQLNAEISRLETGSQNPGLGQAEKTEMNDSAAKLHDIYDTLSGGVTSVNLHDKFQQARGMVGDLGNSYLNAIDDRTEFLKAGATDAQGEIFEAKKQALRNIYQNRFGARGSYDTNAAAPQTSNQGLVPKSQGLLSGLISPIFGSSANASPPITEPDVLNYAKKHNITPEQAKAVKNNRTGQ